MRLAITAQLFLLLLTGAGAYGRARPELIPTQATQFQPRVERARAQRYVIDVSFQPEKGFLRAKAAVTLRALQPLDAVEMELSPYLRILEITDAQSRKLGFAHSRRLGSPMFSVRLAESCPANQELTLTIAYEGSLPAKPLDYITQDGILLRDESRWYPAVDLAAFTENDITITVPAGWSAYTSGKTQLGRIPGPVSVYHYRTTRPVSSRSLVAIPKENEGSCSSSHAAAGGAEKHEEMAATVCSIGALAERGKHLEGSVLALLLRYAQQLGSVSETVLNIVQGFPGQRGAIGYSAPGFVVVSEDVVRYHDYPGYAPEFLPHEIAHQWFPIEVTLARQDDAWLAESLAEYIAWRYLQEKDPGTARGLITRAMRDALAPDPLRPLSLGLRMFAMENWDVTRATLYQRGLLVWRTLETVIDRARVDRALREYYKRYAGRSASIADFRKICEEISGRDLGWFFDYFISGNSVPEIELRRVPSSVPGEVAGEIVLKNVPPEFQVRVEMRLETTRGPIDHSVATRGELTPFTVVSPNPVMRIILDPDARILRWTEAARRNRSQRKHLAGAGELENARAFVRAVEECRKALAEDPENLASNEQLIRFELGRLYYRMKNDPRASGEMGRVLALRSLDPMEDDFNRAWAHVYRARIEKRRGKPAAARAEARAGLAIKSPALVTTVVLQEDTDRATSAAAELRRFVR